MQWYVIGYKSCLLTGNPEEQQSAATRGAKRAIHSTKIAPHRVAQVHENPTILAA